MHFNNIIPLIPTWFRHFSYYKIITTQNKIILYISTQISGRSLHSENEKRGEEKYQIFGRLVAEVDGDC
jgi:hypothetical protein